MSDAYKIVEQLRISRSDDEVKPLIDAFERLPDTEKQTAESQLIQLLEDDKADDVPRSWVPTFLGLVGTETARQFLMERLPSEKKDLFRRWVCTSLVRYFTGDDRIALVVQQIDREKTATNRHYMINVLVEARSPAAVDKLIELLDDEFGEVRRSANVGQHFAVRFDIDAEGRLARAPVAPAEQAVGSALGREGLELEGEGVGAAIHDL